MAFRGARLFTLTVSPELRDLEGRFRNFGYEGGRLLEIRREEMRNVGRLGVNILREEAPKRTGWFASRIRYHTRVMGNSLELRFTWPQPLGKWITGGTGIWGPRRAVIRPVRAKVLRFVIGGKVIFAAWVRGMKPNPFVDRAMVRFRPMAMAAARRIGIKVRMEMTRRR